MKHGALAKKKPSTGSEGIGHTIQHLVLETCRQAYKMAPQEGELLVVKISYMAQTESCIVTMEEVNEAGYTLSFVGVRVELIGRRSSKSALDSGLRPGEAHKFCAKITADSNCSAKLKIVFNGDSVAYEASINYGQPPASCSFKIDFTDAAHIDVFDELLDYAWDIHAHHEQQLRQQKAAEPLSVVPAL